jgi:acetyl-CoA synthetase (ADP-forming)
VAAVGTWSEAESKRLLAAHGVEVVEERLAATSAAAVAAAEHVGFPVVAKLCGAGIAHKTERRLVRLALADAAAVAAAAEELLAAATPGDGPVDVLIAPMVQGTRELIAGLHHDPQYGPTVMIGMGGVLAEALGDVAFRLVPLERVDALEMIDDLSTQALLGPLRGEPAVDRQALADVIIGLAALGAAEPDVVAVDVNPLIVSDGRPVAVDALVEVR